MCHAVIWDVQYGEKRVNNDTAYYTKTRMTHPWFLLCVQVEVQEVQWGSRVHPSLKTHLRKTLWT